MRSKDSPLSSVLEEADVPTCLLGHFVSFSHEASAGM